MWTNGDEVTADDYVASFQYAAEPDARLGLRVVLRRHHPQLRRGVRGRRCRPREVGVKVGADKYQVVFETERPTPFLPAMLIWSAPLHAQSLAQYGSGVYNIDPATAVTSGPFKLEEFSPDRRVVMVANTEYTGTLKPMTDKLVFNIVIGRQRLRALPGGRDRLHGQLVGPGDLKTILADPELSTEQWFVNPGDFRNYYLFFDITKAPFDDQRVRMAFAKAIDREAIVGGHPRADGHPGLLLADARLPGRGPGRPQVHPGVRRRRRPRRSWRRPASRTARASRRRRWSSAVADRRRRRPSPRRWPRASRRRWASRSTCRPMDQARFMEELLKSRPTSRSAGSPTAWTTWTPRTC